MVGVSWHLPSVSSYHFLFSDLLVLFGRQLQGYEREKQRGKQKKRERTCTRVPTGASLSPHFVVALVLLLLLILETCIYLQSRVRRYREILPSADLLLQWPQWQGLGQAETWSFFQVSYMVSDTHAMRSMPRRGPYPITPHHPRLLSPTGEAKPPAQWCRWRAVLKPHREVM